MFSKTLEINNDNFSARSITGRTLQCEYSAFAVIRELNVKI